MVKQTDNMKSSGYTQQYPVVDGDSYLSLSENPTLNDTSGVQHARDVDKVRNVVLAFFAPLILFFASTFFAAVAIAGKSMLVKGGSPNLSFVTLMGVSILSEVTAFVLVMSLARRIFFDHSRVLRETMFRKVKKRVYLYAVGIAIVFMFLMQTFAIVVNNATHQTGKNSNTTIMATNTHGVEFIAMIVCVTIIVPIVEEFFFRGALVTLFWRKENSNYSMFGVIYSAIVFSSFHFQGVSSFIDWFTLGSTFVLGLINAMLLTRYKNIFVPVVVHAAYNTLSITTALLAAGVQ